ncbi:uncharacterized protein TNCV_3413811 [Trichonephila clavipes]|uniref:Uncharacterized protein n=1 Tax=Trichonephila clavipes TaxID=2585209 RepID=A0A8X6V5M0_TRICX|nr:uncharacterized protein TNCV_3413811 [Trichonephila clavipes]
MTRFLMFDQAELLIFRSVGGITVSIAAFQAVDPGTHERNPRCSRRRQIDEADISTNVSVDQCSANCLEEAVRSFTAMRSRCRSSRAVVTFRHPLPVFRVVG